MVSGLPGFNQSPLQSTDNSTIAPTASSQGGRYDGLDLSAGNISGPATGGGSSSLSARRGLPSGSQHWVNYALVGIAALVAIKLLKSSGGGKCKNC